MITQSQIEARNFTLYSERPKSITNYAGDRANYLVIAENSFGNHYLIQLIYYDDDGLTAVTSYYINPIKSKEYFFMGVITTEAELDDMLDDLNVTLTVVDLATLASDWK